MSSSSIWPMDRTLRCCHSGPEWTWEQWQWRCTPHFPKLQHYWNFTIRLFSVKSRTLKGKSYPSAEMQSVYSSPLADWAITLSLSLLLFFIFIFLSVKPFSFIRSIDVLNTQSWLIRNKMYLLVRLPWLCQRHQCHYQVSESVWV